MHPRTLLELCAQLLERVLRFEQPADAVLASYYRENKGLGPRERSTLSDTVYSVLRHKPLYEHLAASGGGSMARRLAILGFAGARDFLTAALSEDEARWLARCDAIDQSSMPEGLRHQMPVWLAETLKARLGDGFWPLVRSLKQPAALDLRVNALRARRGGVQAELAKAGLISLPCPYSPWGLRLEGKPSLARVDLFQNGSIEVQDEGSQLLSLLVEARRGEMVVDFCAGAGGKALALAATMRNTGRVYALDTSAHRLEGIKPRLARSGISNVHLMVIAHERDDRLQRLAGKVDRVLVDAPCSGLGTLRRHPDLQWRQTPKDIAALAGRQINILAAAASLVKPGGRLVYATCSLLDVEDEAIADSFGQSHPDFKPVDAQQALQRQGVADAEALCERSGNGVTRMRLWPHRHQTDGFFAAIWQKDGPT